jgi:endogenous inhibitor of DNA gyrase (YacG/DUF329 family)
MPQMSSMTSKLLQRKPSERDHRIKCPVCKKSGDWFAGKYGPFCSYRCKLVDLGRWLGEEHTISGPLRPEHSGKMEAD